MVSCAQSVKVERKPWPVILVSSPIRRRTIKKAMLDSGLFGRRPGNTYGPLTDSALA